MPPFFNGSSNTNKLAAKRSVESVIEQIAQYNEYGNALRRARSMREIAEHLSQIAELAEQTVVNEADDWFDAHTLKRNMTELKKFTSEFAKYANEADMLEQRMTALYDDMGHILNRYFEIQQDQQQVAIGLPQTQEEPSTGDSINRSVVEEDDPLATISTPVPPVTDQKFDVAGHKLDKKDVLTARAVQLVYKKLKNENPELAKRFRALPPEKMIEAVWKLIK
jgi:hypothetical protein